MHTRMDDGPGDQKKTNKLTMSFPCAVEPKKETEAVLSVSTKSVSTKGAKQL